MVAVIHSGKSLRRALNYNEQKVKQQKANCLVAVNYPKNVEDLNFYQKLSRLTNLAELNQRAEVKSVHISLNFHPGEKLSDEKMKSIAIEYMEQIGFREQPFLIYRHEDSGHPHLHLVTTNIKADGKRIELHNLGKTKSEQARKYLEEKYKLVKADRKAIVDAIKIPKIDAKKVIYGETETKRAITNVLDKIINQYKYASLVELNAVLQLYNVRTERGKEDSRVFQKGGLLYRVLDTEGKAVGVPIKASSIYSQPTLKKLTGNFEKNEQERKPHRQRVKTVIDWALHGRQLTAQQFIAALKKEGIHTALRRNGEGFIYGITYVDHKTKCVFKGSDIGKAYSAKAIQERCIVAEQKISDNQSLLLDQSKGRSSGLHKGNLINSRTPQPQAPPGELRVDKKKRKRRRVRL